ncbi:hypothetical protein [Ancylobacter radicis]|uniref:Helix-turn-helix domain-containing protein n=1 Tax=Ancylobacter radicis TaxID=2836179 RepID=A0ABS5R580_9HYPH|nr:hypothetical protein [Ancylobacter radicis]MBS9475542.1 hypothetical protein [Ancylobacter radicis]
MSLVGPVGRAALSLGNALSRFGTTEKLNVSGRDTTELVPFSRSAGAVATMRDAISVTGIEGLDDLSRRLWNLHGSGLLNDEEAQALSVLIEARRGSMKRFPCPPSAGRALQIMSRFAPRRRQTSPDREASRQRRRSLGGSGSMPDKLRGRFTEAERAVLAIVAGEVKHRGACDLPIDKIAALAGVCRTSVQNALHEARRLGLIRVTNRPRRGAKSLPNMVEIVSPEWLAWIKRGPTAHRPIGSKSVARSKIMNPTKSKEKKEAFESRDGNTRQFKSSAGMQPVRRLHV